MLRAVRAFDRLLHVQQYPALAFPQLYVLHRGYRSLRELEPHLCEPCAGAYVAMDDPRHRSILESNSKERKRGMKMFRAMRPSAKQNGIRTRHHALHESVSDAGDSPSERNHVQLSGTNSIVPDLRVDRNASRCHGYKGRSLLLGMDDDMMTLDSDVLPIDVDLNYCVE